MLKKLHFILNFGRRKVTHNDQMVRVQWRLGVLAIILAGVLWHYDLLAGIEKKTEDLRTQVFWKQSPEPSDRIVVVTIDDQAEDNVGRWPWDRENLAAIIRELKRAGNKTVALDLLLSEPQRPRLAAVPADPFEDEATAATRVMKIDDDAELARAIKEHGGVVIAGNFKFGDRKGGQAVEPKPKVQDQDAKVVQVPVSQIFDLVDDINQSRKEGEPRLALDAPETLERLGLLIHKERWRTLSEDSTEKKNTRTALEAAVTLSRRGLANTIRSPRPTPEGVTAHDVTFAFSIEPSVPTLQLAAAAARIGIVTFDSYDADSVVRKVPLWIEHRQALWPTLGMAAVMQHEGLSMKNVSIVDDETRLLRQDGSMQRIQMMTSMQRQGYIEGLHYITWPRGLYFRPAYAEGVIGWQWQFYLPPGSMSVKRAGEEEKANANREVKSDVEGSGKADRDESLKRGFASEISAGRLYEPTRVMAAIHENLRKLGRGVRDTLVHYHAFEESRYGEFKAELRALLEIQVDDPAWNGRFKRMTELLEEASDAARESLALELTPEDGDPFEAAEKARKDRSPEGLKALLTAPLPAQISKLPADDPKTRELTDRIANLRTGLQVSQMVLVEIRKGQANIADLRAELQDRLLNRIVFFGFSATGAIADYVATSIHPRTPGVHVHAAVANAILKKHMKVAWYSGLDYAMIGVLGFLGTLIGIRSTVAGAPVFVVLLLGVWFSLTGSIIWDGFNTLNSFSGPGVAALAGTGVVLLHRLFVEQKDRRRVEDRFKAYVAPDVVDELVNNPELASMVPQAREMTVMFTDVADFTTTSERLGPVLLAQFLDKYLGEMTRILQANRGTRDKYLGDGIMCFWNAPRDDAAHALNACVTAVKMLQRVDELNEKGGFGDAGAILVRIGIATGPLMVGDFGNPPVNSSYTVLGDTANLSSRLEGANKFFGSRILATQKTKELAGGNLRWRRIGKVNVKGKKEAELLWELIGDLAPHGPATNEWIEQTDLAVTTYQSGDFEAAEALFKALEARFGDDKLGEIYNHSMELWKARPDRASAFDGAIVLTEK